MTQPPSSTKIMAYMEPWDAATVKALAAACERSVSKTAQLLIFGVLAQRGWRQLSPVEAHLHSQLQKARRELSDGAIQALIPTLPPNGPRSGIALVVEPETYAILSRVQTSDSDAARSLIEEALEHLLEDAVDDDKAEPLSEEASRVAAALDAIEDPALRQSLAATIERMVSLAGGPAALAQA